MKQSKHKKLFAGFALLLLVSGMVLWRMLPRSFEDIAKMHEKNTVGTSEHIDLWHYASADVWANGSFYELKVGRGEELNMLWNILSSTKYRQSFWNVFPWLYKIIGYPVFYREPNAYVLFMDDAATISLSVDFYSSEAVSVDGRIYYPMDERVQEELVNYVCGEGRER